MIRLSINLPTKRRIDVSLVKSRSASEDEPLIPDLGKIVRARSGNKVSRFFRHFFEHKKIKKILGFNLVVAALTTSSLGYTASADVSQITVTNHPNTVLTTESGIRYPLDQVRVTQNYKFCHPGVDFDGITGDPVYPIMNGVVSNIQHSNFGYGNAILVNHGNNIRSLYAHLSQVLVQIGQEVSINSVIGTVGATGRAFGDHLHLEVHENSYQINPFIYLPH